MVHVRILMCMVQTHVETRRGNCMQAFFSHLFIPVIQGLFLIVELIFSHIHWKPASPSNASVPVPLELVLQI